jgi:transcriptional regulator with XRE-family HTH domain
MSVLTHKEVYVDVSIGARIKAARTAAGMTQMDVARRTDLSLQAVGDIERGIVRDPHISSLRQIAYALDVPVEMLVKEEEAEPALPLDETPQEEEEEESGPPVVHFAKLSDDAYEEVRENARTPEEREDLRRRVDVEYEQLSRWVRGLREEEEVGAPSGDIDEARELLKRVRKRRDVAVFDVSESVIAFDEKRPPRLSRTAGKTVDEAYEEIQGKAKEGAALRPGEGSREQQPL